MLIILRKEGCNLRKRLMACLLIAVIALAMVGCGSQKQPPVNNPEQQNEAAKQDAETVKLTPIPEGTPIGTAVSDLTQQLMGQRDVIGVNTYEQRDVYYGDIVFKSGVTKGYAHNLIKEFLEQLKVANPGQAITTQAVSDDEVLDSISFKP